jgi:hypothetical protein
MATVPPPTPGRPKRHPVDVLRTQLWFRVVQLQSGLPSAYAIEQALEPRLPGNGDSQIWRPRKWDSYEKGRKVPTQRPGRRDAVAVAEAAYPGTATRFHSPLWPVLKKEPVDARFIEQGLRALDSTVINVLFRAIEEVGHPLKLELQALGANYFSCLADLASFDALVATVLLVQLSTLVGSPDLRNWALDCYAQLQPAIAQAAETREVYPELFTFVDAACPHWILVSPNRRLNAHVFWHEAAKGDWAADLMPYIEQRLGLKSI